MSDYDCAEECILKWGEIGKFYINLAILFHWNIWGCRNRRIFEENISDLDKISIQILQDLDNLKIPEKIPPDLSVRNRPHEINYTAGFFYDAAQNQNCGCEVWLLLSPSCHYKLFWYGGLGTNTRAEVIALWGLMWFANHLCVENVSYYDDSKDLIDHLNQVGSINQPHLSSWIHRIDILRKMFLAISFSHIYREKNSQVDHLSKLGLKGRFGEFHYDISDEEGGERRGWSCLLNFCPYRSEQW